MKTLALLLLLSLPAGADDAPRMERVEPGHVVTSASWLLNDTGKARLDAAIAADRQRIAQLEQDKTQLGAVPALTWKGAAVLVGAGLVVGLVVGLAVRR